MASWPGKLVVLEGVDGAGTTTQVARLTERLRTMRISAHATREPSDGPVGKLAREILTGRLVRPGGRVPGWATMALIFAADRMDHVETEIEPRLANGDVVISDRYVASSIAYQSLSSGEPSATVVDWIRGINARALRPDIVVVLDVPDDVAAERRAQRGGPPELFEQRELQRALALFYRDLPRHMPEDPISVVDGTGSVQAVEDRVFFECARRFGV